MKKAVAVVVVLMLVFVVAQALYAGPSEQRIEKRIHELQGRIDEGVRSGALVPAESGKLQARLDKIRNLYEKYRTKQYGLSDGEVRSLDTRLDDLNKDVYREKHDVQTTRSADRITHRINELQKRIETGHRNGSVTGSEARNLQARLDNIRRQFERGQRGTMSDRNIKAIEHNLDRLSQDIGREKRDRQRAR